jgi:hypothetical protein
LAFGPASAADPEETKPPREVRAQRFVLVDDAGTEQGEFGMTPKGEPVVRLWNKARGMAATLGIDEGGMPHVSLESFDGQPVAEMIVLDKQIPAFVMNGADGRRRVGIVVTDGGMPFIGLYDNDKRNRCVISLDRKGSPQVVMRDGNDEPRVHLMVDDTQTCALDLFDREGHERMVFQVDGQGRADAVIFGPDRLPVWCSGKR